MAVGEYVSLAILCEHVEELYTRHGNRYLVLYGIDVDGRASGALRLWHHRLCDVGVDAVGRIFMLRGLRVLIEDCPVKVMAKGVRFAKQWVRSSDATATEDVTDSVCISACFAWMHKFNEKLRG